MKTNLIAFTGPKKCGKSTVASMFSHALLPTQSYTLCFADALKADISRKFGVTLDYIEKHKENFRLILQGYATDYRRKLYGDDFWIKQWVKGADLLQRNDSILLVPDVKFDNEAEAIKERGGVIIQINPKGFMNIVDLHDSELGIASKYIDFTLENTHSYLEYTLTQVKQIIANL